MDFNGMFRSFFGTYGSRGYMEDNSEDSDVFDTPPGFGFFGNKFGQDDVQEDMEDDLTFDPGHRGGFQPPSSSSSDFFFRFEEESQDMFRHFEEMFQNFGLNTFPPSALPRIDQEASPALPSARHRTPRDKMLKHPDSGRPLATRPDRLEGEENNPRDGAQSWHSLWNNQPKWHWPVPSLPSAPSDKTDRDLDEEAKGRKLEELLQEAVPPDRRPAQSPPAGSYFRSVTVQTIRKLDGTVEQRRTETDADGRVTSTVTSTSPAEPELPGLTPDRRPPRGDEDRLRDDAALLGQEQTASIFEKLFGSWGRR